MSDKETGDTALLVGSGDMRDLTGMTLRDYFAAKALNFCLLNTTGEYESVQRAYKIADMMLEARGQ